MTQLDGNAVSCPDHPRYRGGGFGTPDASDVILASLWGVRVSCAALHLWTGSHVVVQLHQSCICCAQRPRDLHVCWVWRMQDLDHFSWFKPPSLVAWSRWWWLYMLKAYVRTGKKEDRPAPESWHFRATSLFGMHSWNGSSIKCQNLRSVSPYFSVWGNFAAAFSQKLRQ